MYIYDSYVTEFFLEEKFSRPTFIEKNTHFVFSNFFLNCDIYEIMWRNMVEEDRPQMKI
jgi:hypothetical protein